ncbi:hypothetical protein BCR43DRAFT_494025 [Syncephalastrum racemosum]|uniref:Ctf8-domain-containing protein n=1 Tax=Syncephalastrum racemosum TaxID=13706 RepID=A0A1X2H7A5_SYNRA|nr:hypothetical protein BCR43DRAFT_494025 [Syncephalastrum racemosum]
MVHAVICPLNTSTSRELVLLEFQGSFESTLPNVSSAFIGDISIDNDEAFLAIGHHKLTGKRATLSKPMAVIKKRDETEAYDTVCIIKHKYIFASRPALVVQESLRGLTRIGG